MKLWGGRFAEPTHELVERYTASIEFDKRLALYDIQGSIAHATMLGETGIVSESDARSLVLGLQSLLEDVEAGLVEFRIEDEDIHMNVERLLTQRIGSVAGKLHTGRSRNDQVALDMHLFIRVACSDVVQSIVSMQQALLAKANEVRHIIIPGYTHLQRAQPIPLTHHLLAYFWMLDRDKARFQDVAARTDMMPLGAGALATSTFPLNRERVMELLGFHQLYENSIDAVSDRDYLIEFCSSSSILMMHLSRLAEELILWCSEEFGFVELADAYCTGSSMMPQKKNPDVPELVRGKTGRVYGHLIGLLTMMKGLPLAYNKDLQEDKEGVFDTVDTLIPALQLFTGMIATITFCEDRIADAIGRDFSNATDLADYLANKGLPFREAHAVIGNLVLTAIRARTNLVGLPFETYQQASELFAADVYDVLDIKRVVQSRNVRGGISAEAIQLQLQLAQDKIKMGRVGDLSL